MGKISSLDWLKFSAIPGFVDRMGGMAHVAMPTCNKYQVPNGPVHSMKRPFWLRSHFACPLLAVLECTQTVIRGTLLLKDNPYRNCS